MTLPDGYTDLPPGKIASVVTYLQMLTPPTALPVVARAAWSVRRRTNPDLNWYRNLFRKVGEEWLWFSRLQMDDEGLQAVIHDPAVEIFAFEIEGQEKGIVELDRRKKPDVELAFFGLSADAIGIGAGRFLLDQAIRLAWSGNPTRVLVHTCTIDHPRALPLYMAYGFVPHRRAIEIADDPRLDGTFSRSAAIHIPIV